MRKIFLDIGTHTGQTLLLAIKKFPDFDAYIGVEPVVSLLKGFENKIPEGYQEKVFIYKVALDVFDVFDNPKQKVTFYEDLTPGNHHLGSSLFSDKTMRKNKKIEVNCIDVNYFFADVFEEGDEVYMKIDIEGKEYDIFEALMKSGLLKKYVKKLFVEWHWNKVKHITIERHKKIVFALRDLGYPLKGKSKVDQFYEGF